MSKLDETIYNSTRRMFPESLGTIRARIGCMERMIAEMLNDFEKETGCNIAEVTLSRDVEYSYNPIHYGKVNTKVAPYKIKIQAQIKALE